MFLIPRLITEQKIIYGNAHIYRFTCFENQLTGFYMIQVFTKRNLQIDYKI